MEPQIRETDTGDHIVQFAQCYDSTMYKTGAYKGKGENLNTGSRTEAPRKQFNNDVTNRTPAKAKRTGKAPAKRKPAQKNQKPSKAEMDPCKSEGACFYFGEKGHMANEFPEKEVKSNHVRLLEETDSSKAEYEAESDDTEYLNGQNSIITFKTALGQPKNEKKPFQGVEFTIKVNFSTARVLADTGTIGKMLLVSNRFVHTNNIPYKPRKNHVNLKMAVGGSRSTSNDSVTVDVEIGKVKVRNVQMMITPVSDYDILLSIDNLTRMRAVIDCQKNSIYFPKYKVRVYCNENSAHQRSTMTKTQEVPDFPAMFQEVFIRKLPEDKLPVRKIFHRITLKNPTNVLRTPILQEPQSLLPKFKEWIEKRLRAGILQ